MKRKHYNIFIWRSITASFLSLALYSITFASIGKEIDNYLCNEIKKPFFKVADKTESGEIIVPNRSHGRDFKFIMPKPLGNKRIFIVGESVAGLMYWPGCSFVNEFIANPEIINCGMGAYDSGRILDVFIEVMDYQPDIIIVLSGNNEIGVGMEPCRGISAEMKRRLKMVKVNAGRIFSGYKMKEAEHFVSIGIHEERLRKMAKMAKKKNIPLVLCTLPANMSDFPPSGYLPFEIKDFTEAFFLMETEDFKKAEKVFKTILIKEPKEPFVHFYLAKTLEQTGKFKEAKRHYQLAIEWDNRIDRVSRERNEMIRRVAKEEGACSADLEKSFMSAAKNGIIGGDYMVDGVHWFGAYNDFVVSQTLKYAGNCKSAGSIFKKHKIAKLQRMKIRAFKKNSRNDEKESLQIFHYAIAFIVNEMQSGKINERALTMLDRIYGMDKNLVLETAKSKSSLKKYIKANFWTKQIMEPISVELWRPDFHHHLAELFRRNGEFDKAKENIEKALALAPEREGFALTKRLIFEGMKKNVFAKDLIAIMLSYNKNVLGSEKNKTQTEDAASKNEKLKLIDKKKGEEKYKKPSDVAYVKESKKIADMAVKKYMAGDIKAAKLDFEEAIKVNRYNIEAQITMCSINLSQKDFAQALKYCDTAASIAEFPVKHAIIIPGILADILFLRAEIYGNMKEYKKASFDLKKALRKAPTNWKDFKKAKKK
ncbi:MAG: tetratricopeptide repeat protein, partial [Elusimicrobia bacterium]|nr:tetratricopeptide repeat protein [Elusimicrobiota bacterium]